MTFTGRLQELHFAKTKHLLQQFSDQVIHVVLHDLQGQTAWDKEHFSRRQIFAEGLHHIGKEVQPGDIVILSDLDEIPKPDVLRALKQCSGFPSVMALECPVAYYSFDLVGADWSMAKVSVWSDGLDAQDIRMRDDVLKIAKGCWHCSSCFARISDVINKIASFSHVELNRIPYTDPAHIVAVTRNGLDLFDRELNYVRAVEVDAPHFVRSTPEFSYMLNRSSVSAGYKDYQTYLCNI